MKVVDDVAEFHRMTGTPILDGPRFPSDDRIVKRWWMVKQEYGELARALEDHDLAGVAHEIVDLVYVLIGMALEFGIPFSAVWDEVQRANMAKEPAGPDGKAVKPPGWQPPNIQSIISGGWLV